MPVTPDDVRRIASLARIGVSDAGVSDLVRELSGILDHMEVLSRVNEEVPPTRRDGMPLAPDEPPSVGLQRPREDFAPAMRDGFFLVPRLATHDDATGAS